MLGKSTPEKVEAGARTAKLRPSSEGGHIPSAGGSLIPRTICRRNSEGGMKNGRKILALQRRLRQSRPAPPKPLTADEVRRIVREEIARLPRLRLELPARRGGCG